MLILQTKRLAIKELAENPTCFDAGTAAWSHLSNLSQEDVSMLVNEKENLSLFLTELQQIAINQDKSFWGAFLTEEQIGSITLINASTYSPELQIEIAANYRNCGYGYEFLSAVLHKLFQQNPNTVIQYRVICSNHNSIALIKKIGGQLQPSTSVVEALFLKKYHITLSSFSNCNKKL